ncbi:MAG: hypothetical protein ACREL2_11570 [Gemmatimonadales bacterium]
MRHYPRHLATLLLPMVLLASASSVAAQRQTYAPIGAVMIGVHTSYDATGNAPGVGMQLRLPLTSKMDLAPSGDLYFKNGVTYGQVDLDLVAPFKAQGAGNYFGVGTAIVRSGGNGTTPNDTRIGPEVLVGITSTHPAGTLLARPYFELRWTVLTGPNPLALTAGLNFRLF